MVLSSEKFKLKCQAQIRKMLTVVTLLNATRAGLRLSIRQKGLTLRFKVGSNHQMMIKEKFNLSGISRSFTNLSLSFFLLILIISLFACAKTETLLPVAQVPNTSNPVSLELAQITINTEGRIPITSKETYVPTKITIDGQEQYDDYTGSAQIRGRGNSTWTFPKKAYKIKLDTDSEILGLAAEKDWVLLANYLDGTHLLNAVGMKIGQLLNMPFTNSMIPVEVTLNGEYLGAYGLTEQIEVKKNRVDIGKDGILLNIDTNFDEPWQFQSASFRLPVTIKYPKEMDAAKLQSIKEEFEVLEALIADPTFPNNNYLDYIDGNSIANYLIVYMLTGNEEINHPKSTYIYKTNGGKFTMGPIWDFDWAFAFEGSLEHFSSFDRPLFWSSNAKGTQFFSKFLEDPKIKILLKDNWTEFQANHLPTLQTYIDEYASSIRGARTRDFAKWGQGNNNYNSEVVKLKNWLSDRGRYMHEFIGEL